MRRRSLPTGFVILATVLTTLVIAVDGLSPPPAAAVAGYGDVSEGRFFTEPVQWAVDNNITDVSGPCFSPDAPASRGETALYMWNMQGQPGAPAHSFNDVTDSSQYDAISWMSHNGITTGTSTTTFSPDRTLTRAEIAAFLHRLAGSPDAPTHPFVDVVAGWQQAAVSWLSRSGITTGTSPTTFSPDRTLTRAELITFLYRYQGEPATTINPDSPPCDPGQAQANQPGSSIVLTFKHEFFGIHIELKVIEATQGVQGDGNSDFWLRSGNEWVKVVLEAENKGEDNYSFSPLYFALVDADRNELGDAFGAPDTGNLLEDKVIAPGTRVQGDVVMQAPAQAGSLALEVDPIFFDAQYLPLIGSLIDDSGDTGDTGDTDNTDDTDNTAVHVVGDCRDGMQLRIGEGCRYHGAGHAGRSDVLLSVRSDGAVCREGGPVRRSFLGFWVTVQNFRICRLNGFERDDTFGSDIAVERNADGSWTVLKS